MTLVKRVIHVTLINLIKNKMCAKNLKTSSFVDLSNYFSKYAWKERQHVTLSDALLFFTRNRLSSLKLWNFFRGLKKSDCVTVGIFCKTNKFTVFRFFCALLVPCTYHYWLSSKCGAAPTKYLGFAVRKNLTWQAICLFVVKGKRLSSFIIFLQLNSII